MAGIGRSLTTSLPRSPERSRIDLTPDLPNSPDLTFCRTVCALSLSLPRGVVVLSVTVLVFSSFGLPASKAADPGAAPAWAGQGEYRLLVIVPARDLGRRVVDEMPADVVLDFQEVLATLTGGSRVDIASLQVIAYDAESGAPAGGSPFAHGRSTLDCPWRWYDASIPYTFPEFAGDIDRTEGKIVRTPVERGGYFYNAIGDWQQGRLAWLHAQHGPGPSHYAIYFDVLSAGELPCCVPPRAWLGDGLPRCQPTGSSTMGADHVRIDLDDWNGDGLVDIVAGEAYGHVFVLPNCGTRSAPRFPYSKFLFDVEGLPLDVGSSSTPKVVDWDGDGVKDLLVGAEWNRVLVYRNEGTDRERRLKYAGLLEADGDILRLPITPLERGSPEIFKRDYYPVLETVDWDGDGDVDLLTGGYITGRIFFYENQGLGDDGLPRLAFRGPLLADGKSLNVVHWCAAPCAADFDGDGDLDLMTGTMPITATGGDAEGTAVFLRYYENVGSRRKADLRERPFPATGTFPRSRLATPRATDWDDDGDLDLVASSRTNIYLFENQGGPSAPRFAAHSKALPSRWGTAEIPGDQILDYNGDGRPDLFTRSHYMVRLNSGRGNPWSWDQGVPVLPPGKFIAHPSRTGDDWFWPYLCDFDQDGQWDILFGDWFGHVWLHKNRSIGRGREFDLEGVQLETVAGTPIRVGPIGKNIATDFSALQGARTVLTVADFDRDGLLDLVVGDTYGVVRYFRNTGSHGGPRFAEPVVLGNLGIRLLVDAADWNQDGWSDVVAGAANGRVRVFLNRADGGDSRFLPGFDPGLPSIPQPRVLMADFNADGDEDLFLPSTQGSFLVERSFLEHGYVRGRIVGVERRPPTAAKE